MFLVINFFSEMISKRSKRNKGFSLMELQTIVLVVGTLTIGVYSADFLLHKAKLLRMSQELLEIHRAVFLFKDTYGSLPGDYSGTGSNVNCKDRGFPFSICPGNNDDKINGSFHSVLKNNNESSYARNHLIYEGFLPPSFSKYLDPANYNLGKFPRSFSDELTWHLTYYEGNKRYSNISAPANIVLIEENIITIDDIENAKLNRDLDYCDSANVKLDASLRDTGISEEKNISSKNSFFDKEVVSQLDEMIMFFSDNIDFLSAEFMSLIDEDNDDCYSVKGVIDKGSFLNAKFLRDLDRKFDDSYPTTGVIGYYPEDYDTDNCIINSVINGFNTKEYNHTVDNNIYSNCKAAYNLGSM